MSRPRFTDRAGARVMVAHSVAVTPVVAQYVWIGEGPEPGCRRSTAVVGCDPAKASQLYYAHGRALLEYLIRIAGFDPVVARETLVETIAWASHNLDHFAADAPHAARIRLLHFAARVGVRTDVRDRLLSAGGPDDSGHDEEASACTAAGQIVVGRLGPGQHAGNLGPSLPMTFGGRPERTFPVPRKALLSPNRIGPHAWSCRMRGGADV